MERPAPSRPGADGSSAGRPADPAGPVSVEPRATAGIGSSPAMLRRPPAIRRLTTSAAAHATRTWRRPGVQHIVAAIDRFNDRLGTQFAAALTYFSFFALVPVLMVAFSIAGFVLASHPEWLVDLRADIAGQLPAGLATTLNGPDGALAHAVDARVSVGVVGLVVSLYSGISWMGNLRAALQAMWRPDFDSGNETRAENLLVYYWKSLKYLVFLGGGILVSLGLTVGGTWAEKSVAHWFGLDGIGWLTPVFTIIPILLALVADVVVFGGLYFVLAPHRFKPSRRPLMVGAVAMAVAFEVLKIVFSIVLQLLNSSLTFQIFGNLIGVLFFFNLVATAVLFVAAFIATTAGEPSAAPPNPPAEIPPVPDPLPSPPAPAPAPQSAGPRERAVPGQDQPDPTRIRSDQSLG